MYSGQFIYNIGVIQTDKQNVNVCAHSVKEAKEIYAKFHGIIVSPYIKNKKHNVHSLNDRRFYIDSYTDPETWRKHGKRNTAMFQD
jgi:hypothetical protein